VENNPPDLALVDIRLPGISGLELAQRLRQLFHTIVIVVITSYDTPEYRDAAARYKIDHFLLKGASTRADIVELLRSILADRPTA
jgi:YesN/AraC family two-component response regulator